MGLMIAGGVFSGLAGLGTVFAFFWLISRVLFFLRSAQTTGQVVGIDQRKSTHDGHTTTRYHPKVQFENLTGRSFEFTDVVGHLKPPAVGATVPVRYAKGNPSKAEIGGRSAWGGPLFLFLFSGFFGALGIGMLIWAGVGVAI